MHPTQRFSDKVDYYDKFRPHYPKDLLLFLKQELNLESSSVIADIGSGTGISAGIFLKNGNTVYAVEPNDEMRKTAEKKFMQDVNFKSVNGTAENTTLPDSIADFIICAQAFHWFDAVLAKKEFLRILKPNGCTVLIWNERIASKKGFLKEYDDMLLRVSEDYNKINHAHLTNNNKVFEDFFGTGNFYCKFFFNEQEFDESGLIGRTLSCSYIPQENHPKFPLMMNSLHDLFKKYNNEGKVKFEYDTKVFYGIVK